MNMRLAVLLTVALFSISPLLVFASDLTGIWEAKGNGRVARVIINAAGKFTGVVEQNGKVVWSYSGRYKVRGNQLTWIYDQPTNGEKAAVPSEPDRNIIIAIERDRLMLQEQNGSITEYVRKR
mgnify:CR=1 FL=1